MLICQRNADHYNITDCDSDHNWSASTISYSNIQELPTLILLQDIVKPFNITVLQ